MMRPLQDIINSSMWFCVSIEKYNETKNSKIKCDNLNSYTFLNEFTLTKLEHKKMKFLSSLTQNAITYNCIKIIIRLW
jgi:hypothetical protein